MNSFEKVIFCLGLITMDWWLAVLFNASFLTFAVLAILSPWWYFDLKNKYCNDNDNENEVY